jgi:putative GTP pyrophosphokinase
MLVAAQAQLDAFADEFASQRGDSDDLRPVVYHTSRIKSPESLAEKIAREGGTGTAFADALEMGINDVVGTRIICAFTDDVYAAADWLIARPDVKLLVRKDYIANPKPNGYRSLHLVVRLKEGPAAGLPSVEVQLRTIAIDFWATLEHKMKYKKSIANSELMSRELKRCADEITAVDLSMQALRNAIRDAE